MFWDTRSVGDRTEPSDANVVSQFEARRPRRTRRSCPAALACRWRCDRRHDSHGVIAGPRKRHGRVVPDVSEGESHVLHLEVDDQQQTTAQAVGDESDAAPPFDPGSSHPVLVPGDACSPEPGAARPTSRAAKAGITQPWDRWPNSDADAGAEEGRPPQVLARASASVVVEAVSGQATAPRPSQLNAPGETIGDLTAARLAHERSIEACAETERVWAMHPPEVRNPPRQTWRGFNRALADVARRVGREQS
jgi:hypothetical protein